MNLSSGLRDIEKSIDADCTQFTSAKQLRAKQGIDRSIRQPWRVAYLVSHPIQYQAPLLRYLAGQEELTLKVFFESDLSVRGYKDPGFEVNVKWDVPLLDGYTYEWLKTWRTQGALSFATPLAKNLRAALAGYDALWLHGYARLTNLVAIAVARSLGLKVLLRGESNLASHPRSPLKSAAKQMLLPWLFSKVDGFLTIGQANHAYYHHYGVPDPQLFPMVYAVDNAFFRERSRSANVSALRAELGLDPVRPVILFAAKFMSRKKPLDLLEAYTRLAGRLSGDRHPYLVMVGDGELRPQVEAFIQREGLKDVRLAGFRNQSELPAFYALCDVFVLPSEHEPWGLVLNEAMNAGKPVIASEGVGATPDLVRPGHTGFTYAVGDVAALAERLVEILSDPRRGAAMGAAAADHVSAYSFEADWLGLRHALKTICG